MSDLRVHTSRLFRSSCGRKGWAAMISTQWCYIPYFRLGSCVEHTPTLSASLVSAAGQVRCIKRRRL